MHLHSNRNIWQKCYQRKKLSSKCIEFVWRVLLGVTHSFHSFTFFWTSCKPLIFQNIVFVPRFTVMHWLLCQKVQKLTPLTFCLHLRKIPDWKAATRNTYFWKTNTLHMHLLVDKNASMKAIKACNKTQKKPLRLESHWGLPRQHQTKTH